jgi:hypothetical protein
MQFFLGCGLCFCNLLFETNELILGAVILGNAKFPRYMNHTGTRTRDNFSEF